MADLIDRLTHDSERMSPPRPGIPVHLFTAMVKLYLTGKVTGAEMIALFDLQGDELTQAVAIRNVIDGKNSTAKQVYAAVVEGIFINLGCAPEHRNALNPYFNADGTPNKTAITGTTKGLEIA